MHRQHCDFSRFEPLEHEGEHRREHRGEHHHHQGEYRGYFGHRGRHRFGPFFGGPSMRAAKMLASGDLKLIILARLSEKPSHGYEIIKQIEEHSSGAYSPSPGMVYPALTYLEEAGYASSEAEGAKRLYRITDAGSAYLKENRAGVEETLDQLARFGRRMEQFQRIYKEEEADREGSDPEVRRGIKSEWREAKQEFRELRNELKSALYDKLDAPAEERKRVFGILRRAIAEIQGK